MEKVIATESKPIKLWLNDIEENALLQAVNLANLPFAYKHIALLPDTHSGYGMPIGGVLATKGVVIPNAVGVDIGCGMCAMRTNLKNMEITAIKRVILLIRNLIPLGFDWHKKEQDNALMPQRENLPLVVERNYGKARKQIGSLGGGNHFIEIQHGSDGYIWVMIHSGSRNLGKQVADYYNKLAKKMNAQWHSVVPSKWDLAFFPIESEEAKGYMQEMDYCVDFALANRMLMMERVKEALVTVQKGAVRFEKIINITHNYAAWENHFSQNVLVHRKGAARAQFGETGIIPGSQGTKSFIVEGLGNPESFNSCSHGAGRIMGRKQAQRELNLESEIKRLNDQGIIHAIGSVKDLDEAAGAYKDINEVMNNQRDLVKVKVELSPLGVVKG